MSSHLFVTLTASAMVVMWCACSGGGGTTDAIASDGGPTTTSDGSSAGQVRPTAQVIFDGRLELGTDNNCKEVGPLFRVGDFGNPTQLPPLPAKPVKDGEMANGASVNVTCVVTSSAPDEFNVKASIGLGGPVAAPPPGHFKIDGKLKTSGEQIGVHAIFSNAKASTYEDNNCIVRYTTSLQGVAAGRVWGEVTCPKASNAAAQTSCEAIAQFRFENCQQQ